MTSDQLFDLRQVNTKMRDAHLGYAKQLKQLKDDPFMDPQRKRDRMVALAQQAQATLADLQVQAGQHAAKIRERAGKRPAATDAAKMQVMRELDKGTAWQTLARFYVAEKDRAGLAALREQLKLEAAASRLGAGRSDRELAQAYDVLDALERPILDDRERREYDERREVNACMGSVDANVKRLTEYYADGQNPLLMGHQQPVKELWQWIGLPDQNQNSNVGAASFKIPVEEPVGGTDLISQTLRQKGLVV